MEFNPNNPIIQLCVRGMVMEEKHELNEASRLFNQAWDEATNDFEKYIAAYFIARIKSNVSDKLSWFEKSLDFALQIENDTVSTAIPSLYVNIAKCYEKLEDPINATKNNELAVLYTDKLSDHGPFYHGTRADLKIGDLLTAGRNSNYHSQVIMNHIYFTALVNGAGLAAALAKGDGAERVYIVEPTGKFENDPNVTDKKFPGNPTRSYRTKEPLKIIGEVTDWQRLTPEQLQKWQEKLANNKGEIIN
jgi:rifampin ADP-ribosylating transferase